MKPIYIYMKSTVNKNRLKIYPKDIQHTTKNSITRIEPECLCCTNIYIYGIIISKERKTKF